MSLNGWALACLVAMAVALLAIAIGQVMLALAAVRMARQTVQAVQDLRGDLRPVLDSVQKVTTDASKVTALALIQMERLDTLMSSSVRRIDETVMIVQQSILGPLRQGSALIAGVRAAIEFLAKRPDRHRPGRDDEDALFVG